MTAYSSDLPVDFGLLTGIGTTGGTGNVYACYGQDIYIFCPVDSSWN